VSTCHLNDLRMRGQSLHTGGRRDGARIRIVH